MTSTDYVPSLLELGYACQRRGTRRCSLQTADAEVLLADASFDVALSTYGAMFSPQHVVTANEMLRVVRHGGRIGLANWTPEGFIGQLFKVIGAYLPPAPGLKSPALWGTEPHIVALFGAQASAIRCERRNFNFRYLSAAHWLDVFRTYYGPTHKAFAALDSAGQAGLAVDITALLERMNIGGTKSLVVPAEYLEIVVVKS